MSTRRPFLEGDEGWTRYVEFIGVPWLKEVRSIDSSLNGYVGDCGSYPLSSYDDLGSVLALLPRPQQVREYYLLYADAERERAPPAAARCRLLGHDLSDETRTSSLLNCGPWKDELAPFTERLNRYGLLSLEDALAAKTVLPRAWPDEPHADVTVWALYEIEPVG